MRNGLEIKYLRPRRFTTNWRFSIIPKSQGINTKPPRSPSTTHSSHPAAYEKPSCLKRGLPLDRRCQPTRPTPNFGSAPSPLLCAWGRLHCIMPRVFVTLQHPLHRCVAVAPLHLNHHLGEKHEFRRARSTTPSFSLDHLQPSCVLDTVNELSQRSICASFQLCCLQGWGNRGCGWDVCIFRLRTSAQASTLCAIVNVRKSTACFAQQAG